MLCNVNIYKTSDEILQEILLLPFAFVIVDGSWAVLDVFRDIRERRVIATKNFHSIDTQGIQVSKYCISSLNM